MSMQANKGIGSNHVSYMQQCILDKGCLHTYTHTNTQTYRQVCAWTWTSHMDLRVGGSWYESRLVWSQPRTTAPPVSPPSSSVEAGRWMGSSCHSGTLIQWFHGSYSPGITSIWGIVWLYAHLMWRTLRVRNIWEERCQIEGGRDLCIELDWGRERAREREREGGGSSRGKRGEGEEREWLREIVLSDQLEVI